jgi:TRAP-type C4-dicarboxylate transport system permease small subunit
MSFRGLAQKKWIAVVATILFFAFVFVFAMLMYGLTSLSWGNWRTVFDVGSVFAVLGAFYGVVVALDRESGMSYAHLPFLRAALCGLLASALVLVVQAWPPETFNLIGPITGFVIGAVLGWLGWKWAKYVDF